MKPEKQKEKAENILITAHTMEYYLSLYICILIVLTKNSSPPVTSHELYNKLYYHKITEKSSIRFLYIL